MGNYKIRFYLHCRIHTKKLINIIVKPGKKPRDGMYNVGQYMKIIPPIYD